MQSEQECPFETRTHGAISMNIRFHQSIIVPIGVLVVLMSRTASRADDPLMANLRGAMVYPHDCGISDRLQQLGGWGANVVRWQLNAIDGICVPPPPPIGTRAEWDAFISEELAVLDANLATCNQAGLKVIIDLHTTPGGVNAQGVGRVFTSEEWREAFLATWDQIASRYAANPVVFGYDLMNEPPVKRGRAGMMKWRNLATTAARRIREIDSSHVIIVESPSGSPRRMRAFEPLPADITGVVYSVHMYSPESFTGQGLLLLDGPALGKKYPNPQRNWNKQFLRKKLRGVRRFQQRYPDAEIYIGEFSAVCFAPNDSAYRYLKHCIAIFEEYGWAWTYHAWWESPVWNVEYEGTNRNDIVYVGDMTSRADLLRDSFGLNN
jgi:endoglucanase